MVEVEIEEIGTLRNKVVWSRSRRKEDVHFWLWLNKTFVFLINIFMPELLLVKFLWNCLFIYFSKMCTSQFIASLNYNCYCILHLTPSYTCFCNVLWMWFLSFNLRFSKKRIMTILWRFLLNSLWSQCNLFKCN